MLTFQDYDKAQDKVAFIRQLINEHRSSQEYKTAVTADLYDKQRNKTINEYVKVIYDVTGSKLDDFVATNNKIASNFFHRLNTQRCTYSLGNGVSFTDHKEEVSEDGVKSTVDLTKEMLGPRFDTDFKTVAYKALIHGRCFGYWNSERLFPFPVTEFAPLVDEFTGELKAGARFWQIDKRKPEIVVWYEVDGYTKYCSESGNGELKELEPKRAYKVVVRHTEADGDEIIGTENYSSLPIIQMWGSSLHQSTLVGMQQAIDSFDLIRSGFANDLTDCSEIYWLIENYGGMTDADLERLRDRMKLTHMVSADTSEGGKITPYTQDIPYAARQAYLTDIRAGIYEDFGGLDVHTVAAGATNDHIDAAYQPLDENADDFEYQCIDFVQQLLKLENIEDTPIFKRNRISNQTEQTEMVLSAADYLDEETILQKLPFITVDEIAGILARKDADDKDRMTGGNPNPVTQRIVGFGQQDDQDENGPPDNFS